MFCASFIIYLYLQFKPDAMAHHTLKTSYSDLVDRLNRFPQGAPPSELLNKILQVLFSKKEAQLVSLLPIKPFTAEKASSIWKMDLQIKSRYFAQLVRKIKIWKCETA